MAAAVMVTEADRAEILDGHIQRWTEHQGGDLVALVESIVCPILTGYMQHRDVIMPLVREIAKGPEMPGGMRDPILDKTVLSSEGQLEVVCSPLSDLQRAYFINVLLHPPKTIVFTFRRIVCC